MAGSSPSFGRFSGVAAAASTAVVVGGRLGYRAYEDHRTAMARGTCVSAAADLDRAAKECRNLLGADATKSARPSSIIQIDRSLTAKAGKLGLRVPRLKGAVFESAVIERYRRREESVEEALIDMYLAGVSTRRVDDISQLLWGETRVRPGGNHPDAHAFYFELLR